MKYKFKTTIFELNLIPKCNLCGSDLEFKMIKIKSEPHNNILGCKSSNCDSNTTKLKRKEVWKAFLPENEYQKIYNKMYDLMISNNRLKESFWIKQGFTKEEAKEKIFKIQSLNSKKVKNRFIVSKENLRMNGYSEDQISNVCQTPSMISFWLNKGLTEEEAKVKISKNQSNSSKCVDFEKRLLPSNTEYWINRGFSEKGSKLKVSESQRTFSKEKCIEKYGDLNGYRIWKERQEKWQKSLYKNGNIKGGYSKVSQELFDILSKYCNNVKYATNDSELVIRNDEKNYYYDFTDMDRKKIIEYNGDQYHANPLKYEPNSYPHPYRKEKGYTAEDIWKYDLYKKSKAIEKGYEYLIIWDSEYKQDKEKVIQSCIDFLTN
jgi:hypothetical protein